jgi:DUF2946 family protein
MLRRRPTVRCVHWGVLLALLLATLAPSVAYALRHLRGDTMPWSHLCSATGGKRLIFEPSDTDPQLKRSHADLCAYCALHHDGAAPAPVSALPALRDDLAAPLLWHALRALRPTPEWPHAQPRAPPVQS